MIFPVIEKDDIIKAILDDGSYQGCDDWWTGYVDTFGNVYDINVYSDEFYDELKEDERAIAIYNVDSETLETDYTNNACFVVTLEELKL